MPLNGTDEVTTLAIYGGIGIGYADFSGKTEAVSSGLGPDTPSNRTGSVGVLDVDTETAGKNLHRF